MARYFLLTVHAMYARRAITAIPTTEPITTPAIAPFDSPPLLVDAGVDDAVVLVVDAEVEPGVEVVLGDVAGVNEAVDEIVVV